MAAQMEKWANGGGAGKLIFAWEAKCFSTAGDAHMAAHARPVMAAIDDEVVALGFQADGAVDRCAQEFVVGRGPQRPAQIGGIFLAEAGVQRAGAGDPHPVAGLAEIMGHRRDKAELAAGFADADIAGGAAGIVIEVAAPYLRGKPGPDQRPA